MLIDEQFNTLLHSVYEGPVEAVPWHRFLSLLRETLAAKAVSLILRPPSATARGVIVNVGGSMASVDDYVSELYALDPFVDLPIGAVVTLHEFVGSDDLLQSDIYRLSMVPAGIYDILGADMRVDGELEARLRISRSRGGRAFSDQDKKLLAALIPHLQRAILLHARVNKIETERALYAGAMANLAVGTIILDESARVLNSNAKAQQILAAGDGICLQDGYLKMAVSQTQQAYSLALDRMSVGRDESGPGLVQALTIARSRGEGDLGMVMRPVPLREWSEGKAVPSVVIYLSDPDERAEPPVEVIRQLYGFTPTEANLALLLANGLTLDEAATELNVSRNTIRTHLRALFAKTGVGRQSQLVRLILKSVVSLAAESPDASEHDSF